MHVPALLLMLTALQAPADSTRPVAARPRLGLSFGAAHLAQRVPSISPNRYTGPGISLALAWQRTSARSVSQVRLGGTYARLRSSNDTANGPRDNIGLATIEVAQLLRIDALSSPGVTTLLGLRIDATGNFDSHTYGPYHPAVTDGFDYVAFTLAPASMLVFPLGGGEVVQELSLPLAGLADFPWANGSAQQHLRLRAVTVPDILAFDERISWRTRLRGRWSIAAAWQLSFLRHAGTDTRHYARQGFTATISTPVGGPR